MPDQAFLPLLQLEGLVFPSLWLSFQSVLSVPAFPPSFTTFRVYLPFPSQPFLIAISGLQNLSLLLSTPDVLLIFQGIAPIPPPQACGNFPHVKTGSLPSLLPDNLISLL
jgi:hypothetical protein